MSNLVDPRDPKVPGEAGAASAPSAQEPASTAEDVDLADIPVAAGAEFQPDDRFYRVERAWVSLRQVRAGTMTLVTWSILAGVLGILSISLDGWVMRLLWIGWAITGALAAASALLLPSLSYRRFLYRVDDTRLQIRRGYVWRAVHDVPRSRIQHIDIGQGPFERTFGLCHVIVHTAGATSAAVKLDGLKESIATRLRDVLLVERGDDAV